MKRFTTFYYKTIENPAKKAKYQLWPSAKIFCENIFTHLALLSSSETNIKYIASLKISHVFWNLFFNAILCAGDIKENQYKIKPKASFRDKIVLPITVKPKASFRGKFAKPDFVKKGNQLENKAKRYVFVIEGPCQASSRDKRKPIDNQAQS